MLIRFIRDVFKTGEDLLTERGSKLLLINILFRYIGGLE